MLHFIYRWKDSRNPDTILCTKYVGMTTNPNQRLDRHKVLDGTNPGKDAWMLELAALGIEPVFEIVEIIYNDKNGAIEREKYWVRYYLNKGCKLLNIQLTPHNRANTPKQCITHVISTCNDRLKREKTLKLVEACLVTKLANQVISGDYISNGAYPPYKINDVQLRGNRILISYIDDHGIARADRYDHQYELYILDGARYDIMINTTQL